MLKFSVEAVATTHAFSLKPCPSFHFLTAQKIFLEPSRMRVVVMVVVVMACQSEVWITGKLGEVPFGYSF